MTRATKASKARKHEAGLPKALRKPEDEPIEAVIFDMDGVVTQSMRAHFAAWKEVFDAFLKGHAEAQGGPYVPFCMDDYFTYVDGVPRFDGTRRFLNSRGIALPEGAPDSLDPHTIHGLGNLKNQRFKAWLERNKVPTYADTLGLIHAVKDRGIKVGVFSASQNAEQVLESAGVLDLFDVKVDGVDADELRLAPKPDPALLLETARRLGATPSRVIVVEDAVSGVKAGAAGGFRHVIGIDREQTREDEHYHALHTSGADIVTRNLGDVYDLCLPGARVEESTQ